MMMMMIMMMIMIMMNDDDNDYDYTVKDDYSFREEYVYKLQKKLSYINILF